MSKRKNRHDRRRERWESFNLQGETPAQAKARESASSPSPNLAVSDLDYTLQTIYGGTTTVTKPVAPPKPERHLVAGPTLGYRLWPIYVGADGQPTLTGYFKTDSIWLPGKPMEARCAGATPRPKPQSAAVRHRWMTFSFMLGTGTEHHTDEVPHKDCQCGIYAMRSATDVRWYMDAVEYHETRGRLVGYAMGTLSMWGRVVEHELGYRAQYAYPSALWPYRPKVVPLGFPTEARWLEPLLRLGDAYRIAVFPEQPLAAEAP